MKTKAQMALMILRHQYKRAIELKKRVWKIDFYTACLCIIGIIVGVVLLVLKESLTDLNSIISITVSSASSLVSGNSDFDLEKEIKGPDFDNLAEPAALIVESELISKNNETTKLEAAQSLYAFLGCIALLGIAGYDFFNFVTGRSNGIYVDIALIILGVIGLLYCLRALELKRFRFSRIEEEKILYHLKGLKEQFCLHKYKT
ncbi:8894_t:CDS:2 [Cetraspora pellucida]|uniref:8894_t:CDS:1 n=1 Tax=Cetraspora pellucida TaxID=1433469 RepID=A0A9N9ET65_9GLOM|nr:8894_t:CDS:2 [Cetraspora pellucida]